MAGLESICFVSGVDVLPEPDDDEIIDSGIPIFDVVSVEVVGPLALLVRFEDGVEGHVRFEPSTLRNWFAALNDPAFFAQVGIANGTVSWPNEMPDLAPDAMYDQFVAHGEWILN